MPTGTYYEGEMFDGRSQIVDKESRTQIPDGCYDTGDGFYNPLTRVVTDYNGCFLRNAGRFGDILLMY
ncbi:unnamed protein product [Schistosoma mattheei]|uniref:Uncharacterized protein n=1 Tax=Schistosoma mattheei TaxID=31246 RepID=A0A183PI65_9TREM|nr:unnamed protein product [Schistosoma mattheei]